MTDRYNQLVQLANGDIRVARLVYTATQLNSGSQPTDPYLVSVLVDGIPKLARAVYAPGAAGDYNQSLDVYGEGLGLVTSNPLSLDFKAPLVVTEPSPDVVRVTISGERTVATHYRNVAVDGYDSASVRRWAMYSSGTFESYDANGFTRASLGNGSLSLYDSVGTETATIPTTGNPSFPPRFANTPTVGPLGSAVPVSLSGHGHTSLDISDFAERAQDAVAAMLAAGTGVTLAYDDTANTLTITGTAGSGTTDPEIVRDTIGVAMIGAGLISIVVNDAADTITLSTTATANSTDAQLRDRATHTGAQAIATVTGLQTALDSKSSTVHTVSRTISNFTITTTGAVVPTATLGITVGANEVWEFVIDLFTGCSGTGGTKWGIYCTQTATVRGSAIGMAASPTAVTSASLTTNAGLSGVAFNTAARQDGWVRIAGIIANGATAGIFYPVWGAGVAGETSTLYANSLIVAHRIG